MGPQPLGPQDPDTVGPFELLARLGSGGMGRVYLARVPDGGPAVAVKVVDADYARGRDYRPRFRAEVAAARTVRSPYVAALVDADPEAATPWLATAYLPGGSLRDLVHECGALPEGVVRRLGAGLAEALAAIHGAGLAHRDLTPANVLLTRDGPRVIDFGIARAAGAPTLTRTGAVIGTPGYVAPEHAAGFRAGPAGDLYALGAVLLFAATGNAPHAVPGPGTGGSGPPWRTARLAGRGPDLRGVPVTLRPLLRELLAQDPLDRPVARSLAARLLPGTDPAGAGPTYTADWLPEPVREAVRRDAAAADAYLARAATIPASTATGAGTGAADRAAGPGRRGLLLAGAAVGATAAGFGLAALLRPHPAAPAPVQLEPLWQVGSAPPELRFASAGRDRAVVYTDQSTLIAVDSRQGTELWRRATDSPMTDPQVSDRQVVVLNGSALLCLDAATGAVRATVGQVRTADGPIVPTTLVAADGAAVYGGGPVPVADGLPTRFGWFSVPPGQSAATWSFTEAIELSGLIYTPASAFRGLSSALLLLADDTGNLVARSPGDGGFRWSYLARGLQWVSGAASVIRSSWATVPADGRRIFVPTYQDESVLQSLGAGDRSELRHVRLPAGANGPWTPAVVHRDLVITSCGEPLLRGYDPVDLQLRWTCPLPAPPAQAAPLVVRDSLYVPGALGHLYQVDLLRGRVSGSFAPDSRFGAEWRLATDGTLLFAAFGPALYALTVP
ncbi:PQQ-binding-like beta-propeller repeat protein [Kitasatospora sp. NPDC058965]|uniref:serine/threonine-protein kinase n=1 Tax=Kitasatospora sp. NPDC058965 TaxID=3346682 RepID=UPI003696B321